MGVVPPLYFVALKCREPVVRRRAISLIKKAPERESIWKSLPTARIAERVLQLEETGLAQPQVPCANCGTVTLPEESKRIHDVEVLEEIPAFGGQPIEVKLTRYYRDPNGVLLSRLSCLNSFTLTIAFPLMHGRKERDAIHWLFDTVDAIRPSKESPSGQGSSRPIIIRVRRQASYVESLRFSLSSHLRLCSSQPPRSDDPATSLSSANGLTVPLPESKQKSRVRSAHVKTQFSLHASK